MILRDSPDSPELRSLKERWRAAAHRYDDLRTRSLTWTEYDAEQQEQYGLDCAIALAEYTACGAEIRRMLDA